MTWVSNMFSIYIDVVMLCIGLYMTFVQSKNLIQIDHMNKEGQFVKIIGWFYIVMSLVGFVIVAVI